MKKTALVIFAGTCALLTGCSTPQTIYVPQPVQQQPQATAPIRNATQADADFVLVNEVSLKLRARLSPSGTENAFNQKLMQRLAAGLNNTADIVFADPGDVKIILSSSFEQKDADSGFYRIRCEQVTATVLFQGKQVASKIVEPRELPRKAGLQNAKDQYLNPVVTVLVPFLQKELLNLSNTELAVSELNFGLANKQKKTTSSQVAMQVNRIKNTLEKLDGVVNYTIVSQDVTNATCSFRVVYRKSQFPQGFANALNLELANN